MKHYELFGQNLAVSGGSHIMARKIHPTDPSTGTGTLHHGIEYPNPLLRDSLYLNAY